MSRISITNFAKTVEKKLDLILDRCKRNMSDFSTYETEMIEIRKNVAENNSDEDSPLFKTYIRHLEVIDKYIYFDEKEKIYRATATGLMFKGYVNQKRKQHIDRIIKASAIPTLIVAIATFIFITLKKAKPSEIRLEYPAELQILSNRINTLDSLYKQIIGKDTSSKLTLKVVEKPSD